VPCVMRKGLGLVVIGICDDCMDEVFGYYFIDGFCKLRAIVFSSFELNFSSLLYTISIILTH